MESLLGIVFILSGYTNGLDMTLGAGFHDEENPTCELRNAYTYQCNYPTIGGNPAGIARISTSPKKGWSINAYHISSISDGNDKGLNMISVEYTVQIFKGKK